MAKFSSTETDYHRQLTCRTPSTPVTSQYTIWANLGHSTASPENRVCASLEHRGHWAQTLIYMKNIMGEIFFCHEYLIFLTAHYLQRIQGPTCVWFFCCLSKESRPFPWCLKVASMCIDPFDLIECESILNQVSFCLPPYLWGRNQNNGGKPGWFPLFSCWPLSSFTEVLDAA